MFRTNRRVDDQLDRAGQAVLRAAACNEAETEAAASAPFLYKRLQAAIAEEQRRRDEVGGWLSLFFVARKAVPAMALIAVLAAIMTIWSAPIGSPATTARFDDETLFDMARDPGVEQVVLANGNSLSGDEVFSIVVDRNEREKQ